MDKVAGAVNFIAWALGAVPAGMFGWWLGGYTHLVALPPAITYRIMAAVALGLFAGVITLTAAEGLTDRWVKDRNRQ